MLYCLKSEKIHFWLFCSLQESRIYAVAKSGMRVSEATPGARGPGRGESPAARNKTLVLHNTAITFLLLQWSREEDSKKTFCMSNPVCVLVRLCVSWSWVVLPVVWEMNQCCEVTCHSADAQAAVGGECGRFGSVIAAFDGTSSGPRLHTPVQMWAFREPRKNMGGENRGRRCFLISCNERTWSGCNYCYAFCPTIIHLSGCRQ